MRGAARIAILAAICGLPFIVSARADDCEASAAQLVAMGGEIGSRTKHGYNATLRGEKVELLCDDLASVTLEAPTRLPSRDFFTAFAMAATAVVPQDWSTIRERTFECQKAALRDPTGYRRLDFDRGTVFCEVSKASLRLTAAPLRSDARR